VPRVFIGLTEVAGYYRGLKRGFDELGIPATYVDLDEHRFQYAGDHPSALVRAIKRLRRTPGATPRMINRALRGLLFGWAIANHDVFIFGFNSSFIDGHKDLPILRRLGKKVIFQFHGSDSRPPYIDGSVMASDRGFSIADCIRMTEKKKRVVSTIDRWADVVVDTPTQGHLHERELILWMRVGLPCRPIGAPELLAEPLAAVPGAPVRILHSPSHPLAKGTDQIRRAIEALKARGVPLELIEISGRPHAEVLAELARCDLVIDQLYADYGMPGFATEAAWFGKPTLIGGYAKPLWDQLLPPEAIPPTAYVHPDAFGAELERLVRDRSLRLDLGRRARKFVETEWHPKRVAERYLMLARGEVPAGWSYDPRSIRYVEGCCAPKAKVEEWVRAVVAEGGAQALQLRDKPELERMLVGA
jgi:hypothetical protein